MAHTADLTSDTEPAKAAGKPSEATSLRPGRAARAIVSDGRAVHDAIEAILAAPEESREVARRAYTVVRDQLVAGELDTLSHSEELRDELGRRWEGLAREVDAASAALFQARRAASERFETEIQAHLADLNMAGTRFDHVLQRLLAD